jgi:hypothetical protein
MSGLLYVRNADGTATVQQQAALKRWKSEHASGHQH